MSDPVTMSDRAGRTLYVGNLPGDISRRDVENLFEKYGHITEIDLKLQRLPGFCFIEFDDPRDAEDAIRGRDGYNFDGNRLRVELSYCGQAWHPSSSNRRPSSSRGRYSSYSSGTGGGRREGISRRSRYSVRVTGLPSSASWQDLKDHMRRAGAVSYSQVFNDRSGKAGVVDYANHEDMESAIRNLDDSEFKNAFSRAFIQVTQITRPGRSYSRSRSRSRSRSWSRSRSRSRILDRISRSRRSRSPNKSGNQSYLSVSKSTSPSKSPFQCRNHRSPSGSKSRSPSKSPLSSRPRSRSHERSISHSSAVKSERIPSAARTDDELDF